MGAGQIHIQEIEEGIHKCTVVVVYISDAYCKSPNCMIVFLHATKHSKYLITVLVPDHGPVSLGGPSSGWTGPGPDDKVCMCTRIMLDVNIRVKIMCVCCHICDYIIQREREAHTHRMITEDVSTNKYITRIHTYTHAYLLTYYMPFNRITGSMLPAAPRVRTPIPATLSHGQHLQRSSRLIYASRTVRLLRRMKAGIKRKHACSRKLRR